MAAVSTTRRRVVIWGLALLALAALLLVTFRPSAVPVDLVAVTRGPLEVTLDHEGKTRVHDRYVVSAPVAGRVLRIEAEPGDAVVAGRTLLAQLAPAAPTPLDARTRVEAEARLRGADAAVAGANAALAQAESALTLAATERDRAQRLYDAGALSKSEIDRAVAAATEAGERARQARAAVTSAEHDREAAQAVLIEPGGPAPGVRTLAVRAPVSGLVLQRFHESEAVVPAGEPLVELADPADLEIVSDYLSTDAVQMQTGMPVVIDRWGGAEPLNGRVRLVEPHGFLKVSALGVEEQRVNVVIAFDDPRAAWQALGDGYRVETHVVIWRAADTLTVPTGALVRSGGAWTVFVAEGGRARLRRIEIGRESGFDAQVLGGLAEHDTVVMHPSDAVADGVRIARRQ
jgi:HlyD family secretion protein